MTLLQMKYLDAIVRNNSITKAAEELFVSQPGISKSLIELEKEYNFNFFYRQNNKLVITDEGLYFWKKIQRILKNIDVLSEEMNYCGSKKVFLTIGVTPMVGVFLFPKMFSEFHYSFPDVEIDITENGTFKILEQLKNNEINMGFIIKEKGDKTICTDKINCYPIFSTKLLFCINKNHKLKNFKNINFFQIKDVPLLLLKNDSYQNVKIKKIFKELELESNIELCINHPILIKNLLLDSEAGTFFIKEFIDYIKEDNIVSLNIEPSIEIEVCLVWLKNTIINKTLLDFIKIVKSYDFKSTL